MYIERRKTNSEEFNYHEDRRFYTANFKAEVALAAVKEDKSLNELAIEFTLHPSQVALWKQQLLSNICLVFENSGNHLENTPKASKNRHAKIGQLMAENDFLTKVLGR